jgi:chromosome segregation ATPase
MAERLGQEKEQAAVKTSLAESSANSAAEELQQMQQAHCNMQAQLAEVNAQMEQLRSALDRKDNALEACTQRLQLTMDDVQQLKQQLASSFANEQTLTRKLNKARNAHAMISGQFIIFLQAKDAIANLTADNVTHIGRVQFLEQKFSVALKEREQVLNAYAISAQAECDMFAGAE